MADASWMIYGAYGFTGRLLAEEALRRGHRPLLAGRSADKLRPLADQLGLEWAAVDLAHSGALEQAVARVSLVLHAAGPFVHTSAPMVDACLRAGASYLDVTGEIPVFHATLSRDAEARARGVALISGAGFDVIPTDGLALHVAERMPDATTLEIAIAAAARPSAGTAKSALEMLPSGNFVRRSGALEKAPLGVGAKRVRFSHRELWTMPIPWGDLETAYRTTGIGDITTYGAFPLGQIEAMRVASPLLSGLLSLGPARRALGRLVDRTVKGPDEHQRATGRSYLWARATGPSGSAEAWLETLEGYAFTAKAGVLAVERLLETRPRGALTPALAFGKDFALEVDGTRRLDSLS